METEHKQRENLRIGIIGCGRIAKHHLRFISEVRDVEVVGLADSDPSRSRSLGELYGIRDIYASLDDLLSSAELDVLHVLTPPQHHYAQTLAAVERGINVFVEKPIALSSREVSEMYDRAAESGVSICPDFIQLFHPLTQRVIGVVESGSLGRIVHVECAIDPDVNSREVREALDAHWSYDLPGGIFQNNITHPLYLALYWIGPPTRMSVYPRSFGSLPQDLTDHLEVMLEGESASAYLCLSAVVKPPPYYVRVFCERGIVTADYSALTLVVEPERRLPRSLGRFLSSFDQAFQLVVAGLGNALGVVRKKVVPYQGLQTLIPRYYESIRTNAPPPVSRALAMAVSRAEEDILSQAGKVHLDRDPWPSRQSEIQRSERVLVTGASGYLGSELVRQLVENGYFVRVFARPLSRTDMLRRLGVELMYGDIREYGQLRTAAQGMNVIIHAAAALNGTKDFILDVDEGGTRNVARAAVEAKVQRVVYISSVGVYDFLSMRDEDLVTEESPLESKPELRGLATLGKRRAEEVALSELDGVRPSWTILRPAMIFGNGRDLTSILGKRIGNFAVYFCTPNKLMRLIHVQDVGVAVIGILRCADLRGRKYTLAHPERITAGEFERLYVRRIWHRNLHVIYIPYILARVGFRVLDLVSRIVGKQLSMNKRRLAYAYRGVEVDSTSIMKDTGWQPSNSLSKQLKDEAATQSAS